MVTDRLPESVSVLVAPMGAAPARGARHALLTTDHVRARRLRGSQAQAIGLFQSAENLSFKTGASPRRGWGQTPTVEDWYGRRGMRQFDGGRRRRCRPLGAYSLGGGAPTQAHQHGPDSTPTHGAPSRHDVRYRA